MRIRRHSNGLIVSVLAFVDCLTLSIRLCINSVAFWSALLSGSGLLQSKARGSSRFVNLT